MTAMRPEWHPAPDRTPHPGGPVTIVITTPNSDPAPSRYFSPVTKNVPGHDLWPSDLALSGDSVTDQGHVP